MLPHESGLRWHGSKTLCPARPATSVLVESEAVNGNPLSANTKKLESVIKIKSRIRSSTRLNQDGELSRSKETACHVIVIARFH